MRFGLLAACTCVALAGCEGPGQSVGAPTPKPEKRIAEQPAELQFPLVPLKPGQVILSADAKVHCDTAVEWVHLPDGWLVERHRWDEYYSSGSATIVTYDPARRARGDFIPLDADGVLPRLRIADTAGKCGKWEVAVEFGDATMEPDDVRSQLFVIDHESPMAWYNAPQSVAE